MIYKWLVFHSYVLTVDIYQVINWEKLMPYIYTWKIWQYKMGPPRWISWFIDK